MFICTCSKKNQNFKNMKRHFILIFCLLFICILSYAGKFVLIPVAENQNLETLFNNNDLKIHYYCDDYVLATTEMVAFNDLVVLDEHAFETTDAYAIVYCPNDLKDEYVKKVAKSAKMLYSGVHFFIMKLISNEFMPAKNDGMVIIRNIEANLPKFMFDFPVKTEQDVFVLNCMEQFIPNNLIGAVQHLQDYGTRRCDLPNSVIAQDWLKDKFESFGLSNTFVHTLTPPVYPWWGGTCQSGNVIAVQTGTTYPDQYIVCGCHFDSFAFSNQPAPGADDNATGTAGILETARILSQYDFKRSIIYCTFTAEEC
jgi:hypothetical protein